MESLKEKKMKMALIVLTHRAAQAVRNAQLLSKDLWRSFIIRK